MSSTRVEFRVLGPVEALRQDAPVRLGGRRQRWLLALLVVEPGRHAIIDPAHSTGRFAGATGTFTVERLADAATGVGGMTSGTIHGSISLAPLQQRSGRAPIRR